MYEKAKQSWISSAAIPRLFVSVFTFCAVTACGSGSDANDVQNAADRFVVPSSEQELQQALQTRYESDDDFDVWICAIDGANPIVAYRLDADDQGLEYDLTNNAASAFSWLASSATDLTTTTDEGSLLTIAGIQFNATGTSFTSTLDPGLRLDCDKATQAVLSGAITEPDGAPFDTVATNSLSYGG